MASKSPLLIAGDHHQWAGNAVTPSTKREPPTSPCWADRRYSISQSDETDSWIRLTLAEGKKSLLEFWKALPSHNLLVVDAAQEKVLGITEEEYEYLGHLMTIDELLERQQS